MRSSTILTTIFACATAVTAGPLSKRSIDLCANLLDSSPLCCEASVAGVLNLNCAPPSTTPTSIEDFSSICAADGLTAYCCLTTLLGDGVSCSEPTAEGA